MFQSPSKKIVFQISGSIAAFKACSVISKLVQEGHEVQTLVSKAALNFVGPATLEGLTGRPVAQSMFASGEMMGHIDWARWADVLVLCPATANTINHLAQGTADDLIGSVFLAQDFSKPYLIFPAMNSLMLRHPATQKSLEILSKWGATVFPTTSGALACGEIGEGKLLDPEFIYDEIMEACQSKGSTPNKPKPHLSRKILVTAGGTREPLDGVRYLANTSTGKTGVYLAEKLAQRGHQVLLLKSSQVPQPNPYGSLIVEDFDSFQDLESRMKIQLGSSEFDILIHAAAVSDFSLQQIENSLGDQLSADEKIPSGSPLCLKLRPNPKLINFVRQWSKRTDIKVVGFKLTKANNEKDRKFAVQKLFLQSQADFVVSNDLSEITEDQHLFRIYSPKGMVSFGKTKVDMAEKLIQLVENGGAQPSPEPPSPGPEVYA